MHEVLQSTHREVNGDKKAKVWRKEGWVPGVVYAAGESSEHVNVKHKDFWKCYKSGAKVLELGLDGKKHIVNIGEIQWDPLGKHVLHVSFHKLKANEKTTVELPVSWVGEAAGAKAGGVVHHTKDTLYVTGLPKDMPDSIEVDVSALEVGGVIQGKDISLPAGLELKETEYEVNLATCSYAKVVEEESNVTELNPDAPEATDAPAAEGAESPAAQAPEEEKKSA